MAKYIETNFNDYVNEGFFNRKTPFEKLEISIEKLNKIYNKLVEEAGGVDELSSGVQMGYDNFGNFVTQMYDMLYKIKDIMQTNVLDSIDFTMLKRTLEDMNEKMETVNHVRGVSSISVEEFKFVKRNLPTLLNMFYKKAQQ